MDNELHRTSKKPRKLSQEKEKFSMDDKLHRTGEEPGKLSQEEEKFGMDDKLHRTGEEQREMSQEEEKFGMDDKLHRTGGEPRKLSVEDEKFGMDDELHRTSEEPGKPSPEEEKFGMDDELHHTGEEARKLSPEEEKFGMDVELHHTSMELMNLSPEEAICGMDHHTSDNSRPGMMAPKLELTFLEKITDGFSPSREIGRGGYAIVYKGVKENGGMIAVKKLIIREKMDDKQFQNEAWHLSTLTHQNIVKFVGYCYDVKQELRPYQGREVVADDVYMLLCFEYLPIGSLDKHLQDASSGLNWPQRYKIIEGICNGLHYLHEGREGFPVIHRDLKPANILLDDNMIPKIADFGISRLMGENRTHTFTKNLIGTWPYLPLEFKSEGKISKKLDIFSLGVIIIEIINGQRMHCDNSGTPNEESIEAVLQKWRARLQKEGSMEENYSQLYVCVILGLKCMDIDPHKRPTTEQILHILNKQNQFHSGESILLRSTSGMPSLEIHGEDSQQNDRGAELIDAISDGISFRLVRCPKCHSVLQAPSVVPVYQCGGCGTCLRAKIRTGVTHEAVQVVSAPSSESALLPHQSRHLGEVNALEQKSKGKRSIFRRQARRGSSNDQNPMESLQKKRGADLMKVDGESDLGEKARLDSEKGGKVLDIGNPQQPSDDVNAGLQGQPGGSK